MMKMKSAARDLMPDDMGGRRGSGGARRQQIAQLSAEMAEMRGQLERWEQAEKEKRLERLKAQSAVSDSSQSFMDGMSLARGQKPQTEQRPSGSLSPRIKPRAPRR